MGGTGGGRLAEGIVLDLLCWPSVVVGGAVKLLFKSRGSLRGAKTDDLLLAAVEKSPAKGRLRGVWASTGSEGEGKLRILSYEGARVYTGVGLQKLKQMTCH